MKRSLTLLCQVALVLIGLAVLTFLLGEPHVEGRNAHATLFEIYFKDPFLAYVYAGSIPFFVALHQTFRLFTRLRQEGRISRHTVTALCSIRRCAMITLGFIAGAVVIILLSGDPDDRPAGFFMCLLATLATSSVAIASSKLAKRLERALLETGLTDTTHPKPAV